MIFPKSLPERGPEEQSTLAKEIEPREGAIYAALGKRSNDVVALFIAAAICMAIFVLSVVVLPAAVKWTADEYKLYKEEQEQKKANAKAIADAIRELHWGICTTRKSIEQFQTVETCLKYLKGK